MMEIVLATSNAGKIREYREWLGGLEVDVLSLRDFPSILSPEETGETFEENARIKALNMSERLHNKLVIADDSGLVVPYLNGEPGVYSARYAGREATDFDNRRKLLQALKEAAEEQRAAYFECALCVAGGGRVLKVVVGRCEGFIAPLEKGNSGFGYDSIFIKHGYGKTFAELTANIKNEISHRRRAWDKVKDFLVQAIAK